MSETQGDSNPNKSQELEKFPSPKVPKKPGFRREIAGRLIGAAALLSTVGIHGDTLNKNPNFPSVNNDNLETTQSLSVQDLEKRAEQLYQIQIASPQEGIVVLYDGTEIKPIEWTKTQLLDIMTSLDKLPQHFYLPRPEEVHVGLPSLSSSTGYGIDPSKDIEQQEKAIQILLQQQEQKDNETDIAAIKKVLGEDFNVSKEQLDEVRKRGYFKKITEGVMPVRFTIVDVVPTDLKDGKATNRYVGEAYCGITNENPEVLLTPGIFDDGDFDFVIPHELIHCVSRQEDYQFVLDLLGIADKEKFKQSFTEKEVKWSAFVSDVFKKDGREEAFRQNKVLYRFTYGTKNPNEFVSVAGEFYINGKEKFLKIYGMFIGKEKAEKLYDYMRDKIFRGQEYRDGEKLAQPLQLPPSLPDGSLDYGKGVIGPSSEDVRKANSKK